MLVRSSKELEENSTKLDPAAESCLSCRVYFFLVFGWSVTYEVGSFVICEQCDSAPTPPAAVFWLSLLCSDDKRIVSRPQSRHFRRVVVVVRTTFFSIFQISHEDVPADE